MSLYNRPASAKSSTDEQTNIREAHVGPRLTTSYSLMKHYRFSNTEHTMQTNPRRHLIQPYLDLSSRIKAWVKVNPNSFMGPYNTHMHTLEGWLGVLDICGDLKYPTSNYASSWWCEGGSPLVEIEFFTRICNPPIEQVRLLGSFAEPFLREMRARKLTNNHISHFVYLHLHDCKIDAARHDYAADNSIEYGHDWRRFDSDFL